MRRLLVLVTAIALAASACSSSDTASPPSTTPPDGTPLAEGEFAFPAGERWPDGSWAGKVEGTDAFIGIVAGKDGLVVYVCDNASVGQWFRSDDPAGTVYVTNGAGTSLTVSPDGGSLTGAVQDPDGTARSFTAAPTTAPPIHRSEAFDEDEEIVAGWVTLPSGEQRGTLSFTAQLKGPLPTVSPAPALSVTKSITIPKTISIDLSKVPPATPFTPDTVAAPTKDDLNFVWAAIGDSYASGEGAPVRPAGFGTRPDWGPAVPAVAEAPDSAVSVKERESCHRSTLAGAPVANERLKAAFPEVTFKFAHYACSGAETYDIMHRGYDGPDVSEHVVQAAQGERAAQFAEASGGYDALYMSIGGNDVGFGDVIAACLVGFDVPAINFHDCQDAPPVRAADADRNRPEMTIAQAIEGLPAGLAVVDDYLTSDDRSARPKNIYISKNPDPTRGDNGAACGDGNGHLNGDLLALISTKEMNWARTAILEDGMNEGVESTRNLGWIPIESHVAAFAGHGLCAEENFFNTNNDALANQGDDYDVIIGGLPGRVAIVGAAAGVTAAGFASTGAGIFLAPTAAVIAAIVAANAAKLSAGLVHPNASGFAAYATAITESMSSAVANKLRAGIRQPSRVRQTSSVNNGDIVVRWDDKSSTEDRYEVTVTKLDGTGAVPPGVVRLPKNSQEIRIPASSRLAVKVEVKACERDVCSQPGQTQAVNFVPAVPTGGSGSYIVTQVERLPNTLRSSAIGSWTASPFAQVYVLDHRQVTPAGTTNGRSTPPSPFFMMSIAEPAPLNLSGNPKALYAFKISACSRVGCSNFTPEVQVDTRGPAPEVTIIGPTAKLLTIERPELVIEAGNKVTVNPLPIPGKTDLGGGGATPPTTPGVSRPGG